MRTVADAMLTPPVTVSPAATVQETSNAMLEGRTHAVVVADERGRVHGVASADDVARALAAGRDATLTPIADVLEDRPEFATADEPLVDAHLRMRAAHQPAVPVVAAKGRLVGLLIDPEA